MYTINALQTPYAHLSLLVLRHFGTPALPEGPMNSVLPVCLPLYLSICSSIMSFFPRLDY